MPKSRGYENRHSVPVRFTGTMCPILWKMVIKMKRRVIFTTITAIGFIVAGLIFALGRPFGEPEASKTSSTPPTVEGIAADLPAAPLLSSNEMIEDLDFLVRTLEQVHPKLLDGWSKEQQNTIKEVYLTASQEPLPLERFYFLADQIVTLLQDAHTNILPTSSSTLYLNLPIYWAAEGPVVLRPTQELQKGDLLLELGGYSPTELLDELTKVIPAENEGWVKVQGVDMLTGQAFLERLNLLVENKVHLKVDRNGAEIEVDVPMSRQPRALGVGNTPYEVGGRLFNYVIDEKLSLGLLRIHTCEVNSEYLETLANFFGEVRQKGIRHVAVDLRNNFGGDSAVLDAFLRYVDVDSYRGYGSLIRFSPQAMEKYGFDQDKGIQHHNSQIESVSPKKNPFTGDLYVLTSPLTFSSGNWFAVILKDNGLATIIGEPTGNQPSSYGDILSFTLPRSRLPLSVSYKQFTRPDQRLTDATSLEPDIFVPTTRQDIIDGRDAQMEKLKEIVVAADQAN